MDQYPCRDQPDDIQYCEQPDPWDREDLCGYDAGHNGVWPFVICHFSDELLPAVHFADQYEQYSDRQEGFTRSSWDLITVMYAVEGENRYFREMKGKALFGSNVSAPPDQETGAGYNRWETDRFSKDARLVSLGYDDIVAELLDQKMVESEQ